METVKKLVCKYLIVNYIKPQNCVKNVMNLMSYHKIKKSVPILIS